MKRLGVIGGAGPLASALFYESVIHECYQAGRMIPEIVLVNYPFARGLLPEEADTFVIQKQLEDCITLLRNAEAEMGMLICNTLHAYLPKESSLPFISLPGLLQSPDKRLILATQNAQRHQLYKGVYPDPAGQEAVDRVIDRLLKGQILETDAALLSRLVDKHTAAIDGVVLGCSDLSVLHHHFPIRSLQPLYDSVKYAAKAVLELL